MSKILLITDTHLKSENIAVTNNVFSNIVDFCKEQSITKIIHAGDVFTSRKAQSLDVLAAWGSILELLFNNGIELFAIPGNHDKVSYFDDESYLDIYVNHSNFHLFPQGAIITIDNQDFCLLPFWDETIFVDKTKDLITSIPQHKIGGTICITHIAVEGAKNNDGSPCTHGLKRSMFEKFKHTYVGHYHNFDTLGPKVTYIGSTWSHNYGDRNVKGAGLIDNGVFCSIDVGGLRHTTLQVSSLEEFQALSFQLSQPRPAEQRIKVNFNVDNHVFAQIDTNTLEEKMNVKITFNTTSDLTPLDVEQTVEQAAINNEQGLLSLFDQFCQVEGLLIDEGKHFLTQNL